MLDLTNNRSGWMFGDESGRWALSDCVWWDEPVLKRPWWAQEDCAGRVDETEVGVICEHHWNKGRGNPGVY